MNATDGRPFALVTGASRGIGRAIALALAPACDLVLVARDRARLDEVAAETRSRGARTHTLSADLTDRGDRDRLLAELARLTHDIGRPIQVLVNNAGAAASAPLARSDDALWDRLLEVDAAAPLALTRALVPAMIAAGYGRVINIASTAALKGYAYTAAYSAAKGAMLGWTRALAVELASKGITVNAVCPGFTDTDIARDAIDKIQRSTQRSESDARAALARFSPQGRLLDPAEVAALVAYLARPEAAAINGQALAIDGGETA